METVPPLPACVGAGEPGQIPPLPSSLDKSKKGRVKGTRASQRQDCEHPGAAPVVPTKAAGTAAGSAPKMPRVRRGKLGIRAR